jgi:cytochrome c
MRRLMIVLLSLALFAACNSDSKPEEKKEEAPAAAPEDITKNPDYQKGLGLISNNGCFACHSVADKINGPSYRDVANKYAGYPDTIVAHLAKKILTGGSGVWGETPMIAHPAVSQADAEAMVKYVLLLKK